MSFPMNIKKLNDNARLPTYGSEFAAGADLYACLDGDVTIAPAETLLIHTGLAMEIPTGLVGLIYARSGLASKKGLAPANKVGVIDSDYRGELLVSLFNTASETAVLNEGERVAQLVVVPCPRHELLECDELDKTDRGDGRFGSTGK